LIRVDAFVMLLLAGALAPTIVRGAWTSWPRGACTS
jgi:hypothetical protein